MGYVSRRLYRLILFFTRARPRRTARSVFDTATGRPRDLDDPFSDPDAQVRIAKVLTEQAQSRGDAPDDQVSKKRK